MKTAMFTRTLVAVAVAFAVAPAFAGTMSISAAAPTIDGADIAMLNTTGQFDTGGNDGHLWSNRPVQGQTFTTLGNATGYTLSSITMRNFNNTINNNTATFTSRVGTVSGTTFSLLGSGLDTSNNSISYVPGDYITFTYASPITLAPNTVYGFDWTSTGSGFVTANNADSNYTGGTNYRSGANQIPDDANLIFPGDDRLFHVNLTANAAPTPEPSTFILATLGLLSLGITRRRRRR